MKNQSCPTYIKIMFFLAMIVLLTPILYSMITRFSKIESFVGNVNYTYNPSSASNTDTITFGLADFAQEAQQVANFVVIDSQIDPSFTSFDKYTMPPKSKIEEYYKHVVANCVWNSGSNSTSITSCGKATNTALDASYSQFFDTKWLNAQPTKQSIADKWNAMVDIQIHDQLYNTVKYFVIDSSNNPRSCMSEPQQSGFSYYFLNSILTNRDNHASAATFQQLKTAFYSLIKPRFLANTISTIYWNNQQNLTNYDKGNNASIMYVLGTHYSLIQNSAATVLSDFSGSSLLSSDKTPTIFTMHSIQLYQICSVLFELARFVNQFSQPSSVTSVVKTNGQRFNSGFQKYLDKASQVSSPSNLLFLYNHSPDNSSCSTQILQQTLSSALI